MNKLLIFVATWALGLLLATNSNAAWASGSTIKRSSSARTQFAKANTCPKTGKNKLPCPGWIIDHVIPLCAGGADNPSNMQWQTLEASLAKDRGERTLCAALRKAKK